MPKAKKKASTGPATPSAAQKSILPLAAQGGQSNQALVDGMGPIAPEPVSPLLDDAGPAPAKKQGFKSKMAGMFSGKKKPAAPAQAAPAQAAPAAEPAADAPHPAQIAKAQTEAKVDAEIGEVEAAYAAQVDEWVAQKGDASAPRAEHKGKEWLGQGYGLLKSAAGQVLHAQTDEQRIDKSGDPEAVAKDPFFYETTPLAKAALDALRRHGLTESELTALSLYSTNAAYPMNDIMRGLITDPDTIKAYLPWCLHAQKALAKLPATARNAHARKGKLDPTKDDDAQVSFDTVYRTNKWSPAYTQKFHSSVKVGRSLEEPAFLSTSLTPGAYQPGAVDMDIDVSACDSGRSMIDISSSKHENEVLFPPGTRMRILRITDSKGVAVDDPGKSFEPRELEQQNFSVSAKMEGSPAKDDKAGGKGGDAESQKAAEEADAELIAAVLAKTPEMTL